MLELDQGLFIDGLDTRRLGLGVVVEVEILPTVGVETGEVKS